MRKLISLLVLCFALAATALGQNQSQIARSNGVFYANAFNTWQAKLFFGMPAGPGAGLVAGGGAVTLKDGTVIYPFNVNAPLIWDYGQAGAENVATVGVVGCNSYSTIEPPACAVAAVFANAHGRGATLKSGTAGLQEALNYAYQRGGGIVVIDQPWVNDGGTDAMLGLAAGYANVTIQDFRGPVPQWKSLAPTTLVALATPATRSAAAGTTQVISAATVGTFTNAPQYVCVTYVDPLGGESPCSASYNFTPADAVHGIFFNTPAASTGAVGWRAYVGITGVNTQYLMPITATTCTLSTLEFAYPSCAIGSNATFAGPVTTTQLATGYVTNTYRPVPQGHTIMAYVPVNAMPLGPVQTHFGPWAATGALTATQPNVLGSAYLPTGYLNFIGKSIRVSGQVVWTAVNTATPSILVSLGPTFATGTPTPICTLAETTAMTAAVHYVNFSCTITTNATGAAGTVMGTGTMQVQLAGGTTTGPVAVSQATAAITSDLTLSNAIYVIANLTTAGANPSQLLDLHIEALN